MKVNAIESWITKQEKAFGSVPVEVISYVQYNFKPNLSRNLYHDRSPIQCMKKDSQFLIQHLKTGHQKKGELKESSDHP